MPRLRIVYLVAAIAVSVVGCSDDIAQVPTAVPVTDPEATQHRALSRAIGPSEIVLCLDVSDSVTVDQLESVVAAPPSRNNSSTGMLPPFPTADQVLSTTQHPQTAHQPDFQTLD